MSNHLVAIIIPVYKQQPDVNELMSLRQCLNVLKRHPILFIGPEHLNTSVYEHICAGHIKFTYIAFEQSYFDHIAGYNKLLLSPLFYKKFLSYKFILIYQLDAYVFKDELTYWCQQPYDFIGAPHQAHENRPGEIQFLKRYQQLVRRTNKIFRTHHQISNVGNGGFSLRRTRACYGLLRLAKNRIPSWGNNNEDAFFKYWGNWLYPIFRLAPDDVALSFSIEVSPDESVRKMGGNLPFGCHAFEKYEPAFWRKYIPFV
jgi:hypothetical protein